MTDELLPESLLPCVKRMRGYRIYTKDNGKYLDFFQEGGKSIMGSRPDGFSLSLKNEIEKGNFFSYPSVYRKRAEKALFSLIIKCGQNKAGSSVSKDIGKIHFSFFRSEGEALEKISAVSGVPGDMMPPAVPGCRSILARGEPAGENCGVKGGNILCHWFPFGGTDLSLCLEKFVYVIPVLPFPGSFAPAAVISLHDDGISGQTVSPVMLSGLVSIINSLARYMDTDPYDGWASDLDRLEGIWKAIPPYLLPAYSRKHHETVFKTFLENRIIINPDYEGISALPREISGGEKKMFLKTVDSIRRRLS